MIILLLIAFLILIKVNIVLENLLLILKTIELNEPASINVVGLLGEQRMLIGLAPLHSLVVVKCQTFPNEVLGLLTNITIEHNIIPFHSIQQLHFIVSLERQLALQHMIIDNPQTPQISPIVIIFMSQHFWSHCQRSA